MTLLRTESKIVEPTKKKNTSFEELEERGIMCGLPDGIVVCSCGGASGGRSNYGVLRTEKSFMFSCH